LVYKDFSKQLLKWHKKNGRFYLPWVRINDPYKIWISEIMLQQTQVKTVLRYYSKFVQRFPTIESLANANQETVLKNWEGLGFYKRAINLHDSAKVIMEKNNGLFPDNFDDLITLKGIGKSTANAILIFGFGKKLAILDANVKRVIKRIFNIKSLSKLDNEKFLWIQSKKLLPKLKIKDYTQALMDFGSLICKPVSPECNKCILSKLCKYTFSPNKNKKVIKSVNKVCIIFKYKKNYLVFKNKEGLFVGMYAFDLVDKNKIELFLKNKIRIKNILASEKKNKMRITLSNKKMTIDLLVINISKITDLENFKMISESSILENNLPLPFFVKKIFDKLH
jgi:A/G-specific adenine glycosylase